MNQKKENKLKIDNIQRGVQKGGFDGLNTTRHTILVGLFYVVSIGAIVSFFLWLWKK